MIHAPSTEEKSTLSRGSLVFVIASLGANALNYGISILLAWKLSPGEYGELNALFSLVFILAIPTIILQTFASNHIAGNRDADAESKIVASSILYAAVFFLASVIFVSVISAFLHTDYRNVILVLLHIAIVFPLAALRGISQGKKDFASLGSSIGLEVGIKCMLICTIFFISDVALWQILAILSFGAFAGYFPLKKYAHFFAPRFFSRPKKFWEFLYLFLGIAGIIVITNIDLLFVRHFLPAAAGEYSVLSRLGQIILMGTNIVLGVFLPFYVGHYTLKQSTKRIFFQSLFLVVAAGSLVTVLYVFFSQEIIRLLFSEKYVGHPFDLAWIGISYVCISISVIIIQYFLALKKYWINFSVIMAAPLYLLLIHAHHAHLSDFLRAFFITSCFLLLVCTWSLGIFWKFKRLQ